MPVSEDVMWTDDFAEGKDKNMNKHGKGSCEQLNLFLSGLSLKAQEHQPLIWGTEFF